MSENYLTGSEYIFPIYFNSDILKTNRYWKKVVTFN